MKSLLKGYLYKWNQNSSGLQREVAQWPGLAVGSAAQLQGWQGDKILISHISYSMKGLCIYSSSALEADFSALMRYINSRFTYLLTYYKHNQHANRLVLLAL